MSDNINTRNCPDKRAGKCHQGDLRSATITVMRPTTAVHCARQHTLALSLRGAEIDAVSQIVPSVCYREAT